MATAPHIKPWSHPGSPHDRGHLTSRAANVVAAGVTTELKPTGVTDFALKGITLLRLKPTMTIIVRMMKLSSQDGAQFLREHTVRPGKCCIDLEFRAVLRGAPRLPVPRN